MEGFKKIAKMQCFKEGGTVQRQIANFEKRERKTEEKADEAQDKKVVKKAFSIHDTQQHEEKTDLSKLKSGGRAKKEKGTVKKYKTGGTVENQYAAKKSDKDITDIANTKKQKPQMLCGGKSVKKMAEGGILDTLKEAGTKLKENVLGTPEQNRVAQEQMDKQAAKGSKLAKFFGGKADAESAPVAKKRGGKIC